MEIEGLKISELGESTLGTGGYFVIARTGQNYKISEAAIVNFINSTTASISSLTTQTGDLSTRLVTSEEDITALQEALVALETATDETYVKLSGGVLTGKLQHDFTPSENADLVNKAYVDFVIAQNGLIESTDNIPEGIHNLYFTYERVMSIFNTLTTDNIPEGVFNKYMNTATIVEYVVPIIDGMYLPISGGTVLGQVNEQDPNWTTGSHDSQKELRDSDNNVIVKMTKYGQWEFHGKGAAALFKFFQKYDTVNDRVYCEFNTTNGNGWFELSNVSGTVKIRLDSNGVSTFANEVKVKNLQLDTTQTYTDEQKTAMTIGTTFWDAKNRCKITKVSTDVYIQNNQEHNANLVNNTVTDIQNGKFVRIVSYNATEDLYNVELSDNSTESTALIDYMTTEPLLANGGTGIGTKIGVVHGLVTTGGTSGNPIYLSTNGDHTPTKPTYPNVVVIAGIYGKIDATEGDIFVDINKSYQLIINDINTQIGLKAMQNVGICQMIPILTEDIVIDTTALTLTVATVKGGETISPSLPIRFYTNGDGVIVKYEKTAPEVFTFTNNSGTWYFYWDTNGDPIATQSAWTDFHIISPVFILDWDSALTGADRLIEEQIEMHTNSISADEHTHQHFGGGAIHLQGGELVSNPLPTGSPNADGRNTCISLTSLTAMDDNLRYTVENTTDVGYFKQDMGFLTAGGLTLSNAGLFPIRTNDAGGQRSFLPATRFPFAWDIATNRPQYITSTGVRTLVTDDRYFVYFTYALQDRKAGKAIRLVSANAIFTTLTLAQAFQFETLQALYSDLRNNEIRVLYKHIFFVNSGGGGTYSSAVKYTRLVESTDLRKGKYVNVPVTAGAVLENNVVTASRTVLSANNQGDNNVIIDTYLDNMVAQSANLSDLANRQTSVNNLFDVNNLAVGQTLVKDSNGNMVAGEAGAVKSVNGMTGDVVISTANWIPNPVVNTFTGSKLTKSIETITGGTIERRYRYYAGGSAQDGAIDIIELKNTAVNEWYRATFLYTGGLNTSSELSPITEWSIS